MKKIVFITNSRADWGKLKSLIKECDESGLYKIFIFVTGTHLNFRYGSTIDEISKFGCKNIFPFYNHYDYDSMDIIISKSIDGLSLYLKDIKPDLVLAHGDRPETLSASIVCAMNNILFGHIEGGDTSGTIDNSTRFAVSKLSHIHFVSNEMAKKRLIQIGEEQDNIFIIGSPSLDIILSDKLPTADFVKKYYRIEFENYAILIFHPVTTELNDMYENSENVVSAVVESGINYIVICPNNDVGTNLVTSAYKKFEGNEKIKMFPSMRFEYFLSLLKTSSFIIGNSSCGIMEAPYFCVPTINIGTRQNGRITSDEIINCGYSKNEISRSIQKALKTKISGEQNFGSGNSDKLFLEILKDDKIWNISKQKKFIDIELK